MPNLVDELTTSFVRGMVDSAAATAFPQNAVQLLLNGRVQPDGTIKVRAGTKRKHPTSLAADTGYGAIMYRTAAGVDQMVAFVGEAMHVSEDDGATWDEISLGLREDYWSFATMRVGADMFLFAANGGTNIKRWDGTTLDNLPNAPSGVKYIAVFNGRLYATGHNGSIVQASAIADPETWTRPSGLLVQAQTHGGESPTGLFQIGPHLLIFERHSTSYLEGYGEATIIVASGATGFSRSVGCSAHRSIVGVGDNAVCWLSERGVEYYSPGSGIKLRSENVRGFFEGLARQEIESNPGAPTAAYDPVNQEYHLALSTTGVSNDRTLVLNLLTGAASVDRLADASGTITFYVDEDGYLASGEGHYQARSDGGYLSLATGSTAGDPTAEDADSYLETVTVESLPNTLFMAPAGELGTVLHSLGSDGFVRQHADALKDDLLSDGTGGADIGFVVVSRPYLFGLARHRKRGRVIHIAVIADQPSSVDVLLRASGVAGPTKNLSFPATAFQQSARKKKFVSGRGDSLQVEVRSADPIRLSLLGVSAEVERSMV